MQSILRWSLEHSGDNATGDRPPAERKDLDPAIIDLILGKPDAEQMKEDMAIAVDESKDEEERINALDHLEMLIEHIDNANDLEKLKLWEPLQSLVTKESSTLDIKTQGLWVIGTAVQNNPSAQDSFMSHNPLPTLLSFLDPSSPSAAIRAKAIYALSGLLKHNAPAVEALSGPEVDGWIRLRNALQDPSISVRRKTVFLLSSLLTPSTAVTSEAAPPDALRIAGNADASSSGSEAPNILSPDQRPAATNDPIFANSHSAHLHNPSRHNTAQLTLAAFRKYNIMDAVISGLTSPLPHGNDGENTEADADFEEKAIHLLYTYSVTCRGELSKTQKDKVKIWIQSDKEKTSESQLLEKWNLSKEEYTILDGKLL
ncbi:hypothetical protein GALMADRAFT_245459 [Galerina marginata CBS 339.88]|uniref:Nucleotide exchange factor Fes1 domain-containing protein n=1 Tax=Galerina marginata (strain CBS 339.88) TaxID=685588 RepID=A0A067T5D0_GALM3|nr:hypothetical protein GALMADRAFT_245459 [Galerina marginata CBS 339.88]